MTELQAKLVDMLSWFHKFCEQENIQYYIIAGTMLGSIRHKGFIPWDDDIDVGVPRKDYEKLRLLSYEMNNPHYCMEFPSNKEDFPFLWGKLYDKTTTFIEKQRYKTKRGIYIDIFPLDGIGDTIDTSVKNFKIIKRNLDLDSIISCAFLKRRALYKNASILLGRLISPLFVNKRRLVKKLDTLCQRYDFEKSNYVCNLMGGSGTKGIVAKECFGEPTLVQFENIMVYGLENPHLYLKSMYGDNYMLLPPIEKRISLHDYEVLDLNKSYME